MDFSQFEVRINQVVFDRLGESAQIIVEDADPQPCRVEITEDMAVRDDNGFIKETRCEIGLPVELEPKRGLVLRIISNGKHWRLHQLLSNDGHESRWVALPYD